MTIQGAIEELQILFNAKNVPIYYKGVIKEIIATIQMDTVPKDFHDKTCEAMAKRHTEEIQRLMPKRGEWIPCSKKMPNEGDRIVVQYADGSLGLINSCRMRLWNILYSPYSKVVAWMYIDPWKGADDDRPDNG